MRGGKVEAIKLCGDATVVLATSVAHCAGNGGEHEQARAYFVCWRCRTQDGEPPPLRSAPRNARGSKGGRCACTSLASGSRS